MPSNPTLVHGSDGGLYYLPPGELDAYRLDDDTAARVVDTINELAGTAEGDVVEDTEVSGFVQKVVEAFRPQRLTPGSLGLPAGTSIPGGADLIIEVLGDYRPGSPSGF